MCAHFTRLCESFTWPPKKIYTHTQNIYNDNNKRTMNHWTTITAITNENSNSIQIHWRYMSSLSYLCVGLFTSTPPKDYTFYIDSYFNFMFKLLLLDRMMRANIQNIIIYIYINISNDWLKINYKTYRSE